MTNRGVVVRATRRGARDALVPMTPVPGCPTCSRAVAMPTAADLNLTQGLNDTVCNHCSSETTLSRCTIDTEQRQTKKAVISFQDWSFPYLEPLVKDLLTFSNVSVHFKVLYHDSFRDCHIATGQCAPTRTVWCATPSGVAQAHGMLHLAELHASWITITIPRESGESKGSHNILRLLISSRKQHHRRLHISSSLVAWSRPASCACSSH